jgi:hypothetical protein
MSAALSSVVWHDGQLVGLAFEAGSGGVATVRIFLALYKNEQADSRSPVAVTCAEVARSNATLDVAELNDNARAGNVVEGKVQGSRLLLSLSGGVVEVDAQEFRLDAR